MFQLSVTSLILKSQIVISKGREGYVVPVLTPLMSKELPCSLPFSEAVKAVEVNIAIMRAIVRLRHAMVHDRELIRRVEKVEERSARSN